MIEYKTILHDDLKFKKIIFKCQGGSLRFIVLHVAFQYFLLDCKFNYFKRIQSIHNICELHQYLFIKSYSAVVIFCFDQNTMRNNSLMLAQESCKDTKSAITSENDVELTLILEFFCYAFSVYVFLF